MESTNKIENLKYFIYCRKSSDTEDRQIASLPQQVKELTEQSERQDLKVVNVLQESQSAFHTGRPVFEEMMRRIDNGEANAVLVWSSNRIARNMSDGGRFIYKFDEKKILEVRTPGGAFHNTSEDKFALSLEFTVAKKYSDDLSAAVKRGNNHKFFVEKEWVGCAKPGYKNMTDPMTKRKYIKEDGKRFVLLRKALLLVASKKMTPMSVFKVLNNEWGYRSRPTAKLGGSKLSKASFYRILSNPYYAGLMTRKIEDKVCEVVGHHKTMITMEQFQLVQIILGKKGNPRVSKTNFPFKTILRCGECGGSITCEEKWQIICTNCKKKFHKGEKTNKCPNCGEIIEKMENPKILHYIFYHCTKRVHPHCAQRSVQYKDLKETVLNKLDKFEIPVWYKDWAIDHLDESIEIDTSTQTKIKDNLSERLEEVNRRLTNIVKIRYTGSDCNEEILDIYEEETKKLINERKEIEKSLTNLKQNQDKWLKATKETFEFSYFAKYWFKKGNPETKTWVLSRLGQNLTINDKKLHITGEKPFYLVEKMKNDITQNLLELEPNKIPILTKETLSLPVVCNTLRRRWDSNPRVLSNTRFPGVRHKPLGDSSQCY